MQCSCGHATTTDRAYYEHVTRCSKVPGEAKASLQTALKAAKLLAKEETK